VYDVIVVGSRVAGSSTAMLLARKGLKVLVVDRATFPSDTLSTHQVQLPGVARLKRWGLLDRVIASGTPATQHVKFDPGPVVLEGHYPTFQGIDALYSPRRTILDKILVDAAREAGTEVRERFMVEEVLMEDGRVAGIRGRKKGSASVTETARPTVGADGKHSLVAEAVRAETYYQKPALSMGFYTYWEGVPAEGGEMYGRDRRLIGVWPTNDELVMTYVAWPKDEFHSLRSDIEGNFLKTLDLAGDLGQRVRSGRRAGRFRGTIDLPNRFRKPYGPGWALVGDAGLVMDPITGQGIGDAFRDAELLADAIGAGFDGRQPLDSALAGYERKRNEEALPMYEFTTELASFGPPKAEEQVLFASLAGNQSEIDRFLGVLTGAVPIRTYFTPGNLLKVMGLRAMAKVMLSKVRAPRSRASLREPVAQA
jgi:2-polyprenyl-6-methoxyphenol hydroxylase-like FAD-dependent oxidoreductase